MKTLNEYKSLIEQWSIERNLHTANPKAQFLKVVEEAGEIYEAIEKDSVTDLMDAVGDTYVTMVILAQQLGVELKLVEVNIVHQYDNELIIQLSKIASGLSKNKDTTENVNKAFSIVVNLAADCNCDFLECVSFAYNEIKDRKGKMVGGTFVKEEDL